MTKILQDKEIKSIKQKGLVLVGGCFDVIHQGHLKFLELSKKQGKKLVLMLESDENIKKLKGENRPLNNQNTRADNLSKLGLVDFIILLKNPESDQYYYNLVISLEPAIIAVTAEDPFLEGKKEQAKVFGGKVVEVMKRDKKYSTTKLIEKGVEI